MARRICKRAPTHSPTPVRSPKKPRIIVDTPRRVALLRDAAATAGKLPRRMLFKMHGIPKRTGQRILSEKTARRSQRIHNRGRKPALQEFERDAIEQAENATFELGTKSHATIATWLGLGDHSERAIQKNMREHGVETFRAEQRKYVNQETKKKREIWAFERRYWQTEQFTNYIYSDETHFATFLQRQAMIHRRRGKEARTKPEKTQNRHKRRNQNIHAFGMIGWNFKGPLHFFQGSGQRGRLLQSDYIEILETVVKPVWRDEWILFEDNDGSHGTRGNGDNAVKQAKQRLNIKHEANVPSSPDFNPIERIWRIIKQRLKNRGLITHENDLRRAIKEEWDRLSINNINKEIGKCVEIVQDVRTNGGEISALA